jgi:DNA-binding Lrp family transcriptional regulator
MSRGDAATIKEFETALAQIPEVRHSERLFGDPDYLMRVAVPDLERYVSIRDEKLATLPGVGRITSTIVMKRVVDSRPLAIASTVDRDRPRAGSRKRR